jgi:hypothetical protein
VTLSSYLVAFMVAAVGVSSADADIAGCVDRPPTSASFTLGPTTVTVSSMVRACTDTGLDPNPGVSGPEFGVPFLDGTSIVLPLSNFIGTGDDQGFFDAVKVEVASPFFFDGVSYTYTGFAFDRTTVQITLEALGKQTFSGAGEGPTEVTPFVLTSRI